MKAILAAALVLLATPAASADTSSILSFALRQDEKPPETPAASPAPQQSPLPAPAPKPLPGVRATADTFLDFDRFEAALRGGTVIFSGDFKSDPKPCVSLMGRAPMPWVSRGLLGLKKDDVGLYAELGFSSINRDF